MAKIGHFTHTLRNVGGIETYVRRISRAQTEAGNNVHIFGTEAVGSGFAPDGCQEHALRDESECFRVAAELNLDVLHLHWDVKKLPDSHIPCIRTVHLNTPYCPSGNSFLKAQEVPCNRTCSLGVCLHGHLFDHCGSIRPQTLLRSFNRQRAEKRTLTKIPVIAVSQYVKDRMVRAGYSADSINVVPLFAPDNACDCGPILSDGKPRVVFLGRGIPAKGLQWLLRVLDKIEIDFQLDVAADLSPETRKQISSKFRANSRIRWHGWLDERGVFELLASARVLVVPSLCQETAGQVALEAMAHGRPVIASRSGGLVEIVQHTVNGLLVQPGNDDELADAITSLCSNLALAERLGKKGKALADSQFSLERHLNRLSSVYAAAIANGQIITNRQLMAL